MGRRIKGNHIYYHSQMMQMVDEEGNRLIEPGEFMVSIGGAAPMKRSADLGASKPVQANFTVKGK
jgi:beta-glucosidase